MVRCPAVVAAAMIAGIPLWICAPAAAVVPPAIDDTLLPRPSAPAPTGETEQTRPCVQLTGTSEVERVSPELDAVHPLTRGAGQTIAVIDTGVVRHRLLPRLIGGGDYVAHGDGTDDCDGHGTIVAGIAGATSGPGFGGIAPEATILSIRQSSTRFAARHGSSGVGDVTTLAEAVRTAADLGATVINISSPACVPAAQPPDDRALGAALRYAVDVRNVVVVAAAGNVGGSCAQQEAPTGPDWDSVRSISSPGWYDDLVLCVGSVGSSGAASDFSLAGPWVDVAAPGEDLVSLNPDGDTLIDTLGPHTPLSGTNYAAPVVAGVAALVRSRFPQLTARAVMRRIEDTARPPAGGWDPFVGHGVVDALAAVSTGDPAAGPVPGTAPAVTPSAPAPGDPVSRRVAFGGAAVCVAVTTLVAVALSAWRSRRTVSDGIARD